MESMLIQNIILTLVILILACLAAEPLSRVLKVPFAAILIVIGFIGSELIVLLGYDTGIRAGNFNQLVFYVFLPIIIFESAYRINRQVLKKHLFVILILAGPIMILSGDIVALMLYWGIGHSSGFPIYTALVAGALLAATDPIAVVNHLKRIKAPEDMIVLVEGESLFNDAVAVVLFTTLLTFALSQQNSSELDLTVWSSFLSFLKIFFGGLLFGFFCGCLGTLFSYLIHTRILENVLLVSIAYGSFLIAEDILGVSGMMAVLASGIIMNKAHEKFIPKEDRVFVNYWWEVISFFANAMIFILLGVTITISMFEERWLAMLIAILAVIITRGIAIYGFLPLFAFKAKEKFNETTQHVLFWGGTRGAVTVALALSLPIELEAWWTIQSMAFGVVIFTLFIQAPMVFRSLTQIKSRHNRKGINFIKK